jgi:plasmid stabilization system protein ParE
LKVTFKPKFFDDLDDIFDYIAEYFGENLARNIVRNIYNSCLDLGEFPYKGRLYPHNDYFHFAVIEKRNVVFYHIDEKSITAHRVFDSRRDYLDAVRSISEDTR